MAEFPQASPEGSEQFGVRPAVIVGLIDLIGTPVYPGLILVPFTTKLGKFSGHPAELYPQYPAGVGGLTSRSIALLDQVRYVGKARLGDVLGRLTEQEYEPIRSGLQKLFAF